jgi:SAM-dependent methyltransferase
MAVYYHAGYYGNRHGLTSRICNARRMRLTRKHLASKAAPELLDFGCGDGSFLLAARKEGWLCCGVERNRPDSLPDDVIVVGGLDELENQHRFDCVTLWHVLEHLDDPVDLLSRLRAHLKPGGVVLAAVPNFGSWQSRFTGSSWLHLDIPRHLYHFTRKSLSAAFEAAGFNVHGVAYGEFEYDVIGWSQGLLNRYLRGRNEFFKAVSGRPGNGSPFHRAIQVPAGMGLSLLAAVPAWGESLLGQAGTLILTAYVPE